MREEGVHSSVHLYQVERVCWPDSKETYVCLFSSNINGLEDVLTLFYL